MNFNLYTLTKDATDRQYEFYSEGPCGRLLKVVAYIVLQPDDPPVYNLAFGDWDAGNGRIDDLSVSNNGDREQVLATVASTVLDFLDNHPDAVILATGSTPARTRLYRMGISKILDEISTELNVQGYRDGEWEKFEKDGGYEGFSVRKKYIWVW